MKLTIDRKSLLAALSACQPVAEQKHTNPILANVLLDGATATMSATDLYQDVAVRLEANTGGKATAVLVPCKELRERVSKLDGADVTLTVDDSLAMKVKGKGRRTFAIQCDEPGSFPELASCPVQPTQVTVETFRFALGSVRHAISDDISRTHMNGVHLESSNDVVSAVATDGHRLSIAEVKCPSGPGWNCIIPERGVNLLMRALDSAESCLVAVTEDRLFADIGPLSLAVKLTDGRFPPWQQVWPSESACEVTAAKKALAASVDAVALSSGIAGGIKLTFSSGDIDVSAENPATGRANDGVECVGGPDSPVMVGINPSHMLDTLKAIDADEVTIRLNGELDPVVFDGGASVRGLVMPMRL
jgi:DNA polymerase-3 subunit beta